MADDSQHDDDSASEEEGRKRAPYPYANPPRLPEEGEVDLTAFLGPGGPIELVIGPGRGAFVFERSDEAPDARIIGMEIRRKYAQLVDERLEKHGKHPAVRLVCEDVKIALPRIVPDGCLARVFIHFPDPWWKKRHQKRLVVVDPLVDQLVRLLEDDGELFLQTDVPERAEEYRARLDTFESLVPAGDEPGSAELAESPYRAKSNREKRADEDGLPVYRLLYRRAPRS
jgi:tRNA (guanine-N7-)-methyltransferase